jgi:preprotein translocase subunit SecA
MKEIEGIYFPLGFVRKEDFTDLSIDGVVNTFLAKCEVLLQEKRDNFPPEIYKEFLKVVLLRVVDTYWMDHIDAMSELRQAVRLQSYAQINPLRQYQEVGFEKFETMIQNIENDATKYVNRAMIKDNLQREVVIKATSTSSGKEEDTRRRTQAVSSKIGRNAPCPCGSGKKYKNCCGR